MINQFKKAPVTMGLLLLTVLVFLAMQIIFLDQATSAYAIFKAGGMYGEWIKQVPSQSWRLLTPIVVHIGWEHFILNSLTLYFVGPVAEQLFGSARFLLLYLLSGIMGNVFTLLFDPSVIAAGASTSLFGVFAAIALLGYYSHHPYLKQIGQNYQFLIIINLFFNLFMPDVGMVAHIGGAVGGVLCAVFLPNRVETALFHWGTRCQAMMAYLVMVSLFFGLAMCL